MNPELRYNILRYTLIVCCSIHLLIGIGIALMTFAHLSQVSPRRQPYYDHIPPFASPNQTRDIPDMDYEHHPQTTFETVMNGTDEQSENPVYPEAALVASAALITISSIGLIGLVKEHIVWIVMFGLLSVLFQVLRTYFLLRSWVLEVCEPGQACFRDEVLNTIISVVEILMVFRLAHELRLRRILRVIRDEDPFPDMRTSIPTVGVASEAEGKNQTDVEEIETSLATQRDPGCSQDADSCERRRSSTQSCVNCKIRASGKWT